MSSFQKKVAGFVLIATAGVAGYVGISDAATSPDVPGSSSFPVITLTPDADTNPVGTTHTVTAHTERKSSQGNVTNQPNKLVTFRILSGPNAGQVSNPNTGECSPNNCESSSPDALVTWTYTGSGGTGTDEIEACFTEDSGNPNDPGDNGETACVIVHKTWVDGPSGDIQLEVIGQ